MIYNRTANLAVAADDEVIAQFVDIDVVNHGSPCLHTLTVEDSDEHPLGHPDLEGEDTNEKREELHRIVDFLMVDGVGLNHPEKGVLPAQTCEMAIDQHAHQAEAGTTSGNQSLRKNNRKTRIMGE